MTILYQIFGLDAAGRNRPADAATIPADARGTFHLPPAADTPRPNWREVSDTARQNNSLPPAEIMQNVGANPAALRQTTFYKL